MRDILPNSQIDAYKHHYVPKFHEQRLLELIENHRQDFQGNLLDIGCAAGTFTSLMARKFPNAQHSGFDISSDLIDSARERLPKTSNCRSFLGDALTFIPEKPFDVIVASGVLSIFEDFEKPLTTWLSWLKKTGTLYIFGRFNSRNIDTIIRFRNNTNSNKWESGLTAYSIYTVDRFLMEHGYRHEFIRFTLPIDLQESPDPIRTFTKKTTEGELLVLNGANIVAEHYFLIIHK